MSTVTPEEREIFEGIRQKMLTDQTNAMQEFAELAESKEAVAFFGKVTELRERCVVGSNEHAMLGNVVTVFQNVKGQFPPRPKSAPDAP